MGSIWDMNAIAAAFSGITPEFPTAEEFRAEPVNDHLPSLRTMGERERVMQNVTHPHNVVEPIGAVEDKSSYSFSFDPLSLVLKAVRVPFLGPIDVAITKAKVYFEVWTSYLYRMLPVPIFSSHSVRTYLEILPDIPDEFPFVIGRVECPSCGLLTCLSSEDQYRKNNKHLGAYCPCSIVIMNRKVLQGHEAAMELDYNLGVDPIQHCALPPADQAKESMLSDDLKACTHEDLGEMPGLQRPPWQIVPSGDRLGFIPKENRQRVNTRHGGLRCTLCFPTGMHGWCPALLESVYDDCERIPKGPERQVKVAPGENFKKVSHKRFMLLVIIRWKKFLKSLLPYDKEGFVVVALSPDRAITFIPQRVQRYIIMYNDPKVVEALEGLPQLAGRVHFFWVPLPSREGNRYLASYRVLLPIMSNVDVDFTIINEIELPFWRDEALMLSKYRVPCASICTGCVWPVFAGHLKINGIGAYNNTTSFAASFFFFGGLYGWDEIAPLNAINVAIFTLGLSHPVGFLAPQVDYELHIRSRVIVVAENKYSRKPRVVRIVFHRKALYHLLQLLNEDVDDSRLTFWHVFSDPRPVQPRLTPTQIRAKEGEFANPLDLQPYYVHIKDGRSLRDYESWGLPATMPMNNILQELIASLGGIRIFTFGTRGDVIPWKIYAEMLASYSPHISLVELNSEEESRLIIEKVEQLKTAELAPMSLDAINAIVASRPAIKICPEDLAPSNALNYSFKPPADIIRGFTRGFSPIIEFFLNLMGLGSETHGTIGAYSRPGFLPRSADGTTFLKSVPNKDKEFKTAIVVGSSSLQILDYPGAVVLGPCDHQEELPKYHKVVCPGGAGIVQTAAACGCIVETRSTILDRDYRNPHDAGLGVAPGGDPDNIWLYLSKKDVRFLAFWLRKNLFKPHKLVSFFGYTPVVMAMFRALMLYLLYSRVQKSTIISTDPLTTLFLTLRPRSIPIDFKVYVLTYFFALWIDSYLKISNTSYYYLVVLFIKENLKLATNPLSVYIAQQQGLLAGFLVNNIFAWTGDHIVSYIRTWRRQVISPPQKEHPVYLEFSLRLHYIPVIHTALVCPTMNKRFEGGHHAIDKSSYVMDIRDGPIQSWILIPTHMDYQNILSLPVMSGNYGITWNCTTGLYAATAHVSEQMGVARGYLLFWSAVVGTTIAVSSAVASVLVWIGHNLIQLGKTENVNSISHYMFFTDAVSRLISSIRFHPDEAWRDIITWYIAFRAPFGSAKDELQLHIERHKSLIKEFRRRGVAESLIQQLNYREYELLKQTDMSDFIARALLL